VEGRGPNRKESLWNSMLPWFGLIINKDGKKLSYGSHNKNQSSPNWKKGCGTCLFIEKT